MLSINFNGFLMDLSVPKVMGILNVTPDSFFTGSRAVSDDIIRKKVEKMIADGADIIDVGGCSTRPGFQSPSEKEEWERVERGCRIVRELSCDIPLSIDTFRAAVAEKAVERWNAGIINDVSGGVDENMWPFIAAYRVPYVLTHNRSREEGYAYKDVTADVIIELSKKVSELHRLGVNDVIIDPGFGFAKTIEENFRIFEELNEVARMGYPLLVGISRKSMIYKTLGCSPEESLAGTIALDALALEKGANILRVHDVKEAADTVKLFAKLKNKAG